MIEDLEKLHSVILQFDPTHQVEAIKPKAFRPPSDWSHRVLVHPSARQGRSEAVGADDEASWRHAAATAGQRHCALGERAGVVHGLGDRALELTQSYDGGKSCRSSGLYSPVAHT
jgi:hypothetical protein